MLRPEIITGIIDALFEQLRPENVESNVAALKRDLAVLDRKIANLAAAVELGGANIRHSSRSWVTGR